MESTVNTFTKGLNRDVSPTKYSPENYFDALNVKLITDEALSSFSMSNEKGNTNTFNIPITQAVYSIILNDLTLASFSLIINGTTYTFLKPTSANWTYESFYTQLISKLSFFIGLNYFAVSNQKSKIVITGLNTALTITSQNANVVSTKIIPQLSFHTIIGSVQLREYLILFTYGGTSTSTGGGGGGGDPIDTPSTVVNNGQIWKLHITSEGLVEGIGVGNTLVPSTHLIYNDALNFLPEHRIEAYSNYETSEVGKIYFTDNYNNFRHFNVLDQSTFSIPLSALDIISEVNFGTQTLLEVTSSGNLSSGIIQYAHQYYNLHGSQSAFSPTTGFIHLTESSESLSSTQFYYGSPTGKNTGKAVRLSITNLDTRFTNVKIVSLFYKTLTGTPEISIIEDREIPSNGNIYITDSGTISKGSMSDVEFTSLGSVNFKCKTFDVKDNILFPANITEEFYDVDEDGYWDSRAYRWTHLSNNLVRRALLTSNSEASMTLQTLNDVVPETYDCIQTKESQSTYRYTFNNKRLGGEGKNIRYYFNVDSVIEDSNAGVGYPSYANTGVNKYPNYANPLVQANKTGYMRDEMYRFGIVFKDSHGRKSFVKWVADIKMPAICETEDYGFKYVTFEKSGTDVKINILSLTFEINNIPASAESFDIVRVKREDQDKTILMQGGLSSGTKEGTNSFYSPRYAPCTIGSLGGSVRLHNFLSPEINFTKKLSQIGSIKVVAGCSVSATANTGGTAWNLMNYTKLVNIDSTTSSVTASPIIDSRIVPPGEVAEYNINNIPYKNYRYVAANLYGYMCTNLVVGLNSVIDVVNYNQTKYPIANIVRTLANQYGGPTYSDRLNNKYIHCYSDKNSVSTTQIVKVYGGDTFINYFDLLYGIFDLTNTVSGFNNQYVYLIPLETSINVALRHDKCVTKDNNPTNNYLMQETAGPHATTMFSGKTYDQQTDLYLYNNVYSKENDVVTYFSKPLNFSNNKTFDTRILSSSVKHVNEEIDSWTSFLATYFIDVDGAYGPINKLVTFDKKIVFFQDKALGWASVNERSLITPDTGGASLSLGKGGILDQYFYVSRHSGSKHQFGVIYSPNGLYYYDATNNRFNVFNGERNEPISELKGFSSYLKQNTPTGIKRVDTTLTGLGVHGIYDLRFNRILWTFNDLGLEDEFTISYNELLQGFESFYSFKPRLYMKLDEFIYSTDPSNLHKGYLHNSGDYGKFYDAVFDSEIETVVNKDPLRVKAFTNVEYLLNTIPEQKINFESLQVRNSYQDTNAVFLVDGDNTNRRMRSWRVTLGRNAGNYEDRIRSEYARFKFIFNNDQNVKFELPHFITYYMSKSL